MKGGTREGGVPEKDNLAGREDDSKRKEAACHSRAQSLFLGHCGPGEEMPPPGRKGTKIRLEGKLINAYKGAA